MRSGTISNSSNNTSSAADLNKDVAYPKNRLTEKKYTRRKMNTIAEDLSENVGDKKGKIEKKGEDGVRRSRRLIAKSPIGKFQNTEETAIDLTSNKDVYDENKGEVNIRYHCGKYGSKKTDIQGSMRSRKKLRMTGKYDDVNTGRKEKIKKDAGKKLKRSGRDNSVDYDSSEEDTESDGNEGKQRWLKTIKKQQVSRAAKNRKEDKPRNIKQQRAMKRKYIYKSDKYEDEDAYESSSASDNDSSEGDRCSSEDDVSEDETVDKEMRGSKREFKGECMLKAKENPRCVTGNKKNINKEVVYESDEKTNTSSDDEEEDDREEADDNSSEDEDVDVNVVRRSKYTSDNKQINEVKNWKTGLLATKTKHKNTEWKKLSYESDDSGCSDEEDVSGTEVRESEDEDEIPPVTIKEKKQRVDSRRHLAKDNNQRLHEDSCDESEDYKDTHVNAETEENDSDEDEEETENIDHDTSEGDDSESSMDRKPVPRNKRMHAYEGKRTRHDVNIRYISESDESDEGEGEDDESDASMDEKHGTKKRAMRKYEGKRRTHVGKRRYMNESDESDERYEKDDERDTSMDDKLRKNKRAMRKYEGKRGAHDGKRRYINESDESDEDERGKSRRMGRASKKQKQTSRRKLHITRLGDYSSEEDDDIRNEQRKLKKGKHKCDESRDNIIKGNVERRSRTKKRNVLSGSHAVGKEHEVIKNEFAVEADVKVLRDVYLNGYNHLYQITGKKDKTSKTKEGKRVNKGSDHIVNERKRKPGTDTEDDDYIEEEQRKTNRKVRTGISKNNKVRQEQGRRPARKKSNEAEIKDTKKNMKKAGKTKENVIMKDKPTNLRVDEDGTAHVKKGFSTLRIRSSPKPLVGAVRCLNDEQRRCVVDMGFGALLSFNIDELPSKLVYYVVDRFDDENMQIKLTNGCIKVSESSMHDMVGVPIGGTKLDEIRNPKLDEDIAERWWAQFGGTKEVTPVNIKKQIVVSHEADLNFKINFLALVVNTMGGCKVRGKVDMSVMEYISKETVFKTIDWSRYLWMMIKDCKKLWRSSKLPIYFSGPATILLLLYVDGTKCTSIPVERLRPAFLSWNYDMMSYREEEEMSSGGFGRMEILGDLHLAVKIGADNNCDPENHLELKTKPVTVEEYLKNIEQLDGLVHTYKKRAEDMVNEAKEKFPTNASVASWHDKIKGVNEGDKTSYETPGKEKMTTGGSCENTGVNCNDELDSQFWVSPTLEHTLASVEKSMMESRSEKGVIETSDGLVRSNLSKNFDDEPSFSMGLTQLNEDGTCNEIVVAGKMDPKPLSMWHPPTILDRGKRNLKLPTTQKSPFVKRIVDICGRLSVADSKVWKMISDGVGDPNDIVFATVEGRESVRGSVQSLARDQWIAVDVIDSWAAMLNHDERIRDKGSPHRFFCQTGMMREDMVNFKEDNKFRMQHFMSNFGEAANLDKDLMNLKDVDMVFFPMLQANHYYLICYNMKRAGCYIIDNHFDMENVGQKYKGLPGILHGLFVGYLKMVGHAAGMTLEKIQPTRMAMRWRTTTNWNDCGVFLMRHMECYMGETPDRWDCGFETDVMNQRKQLQKLRKKYTSKLLMSEHNVHARMVMQQSLDYATSSHKK